MREALPAILAFGFSAMDLNRIEAFIDPANVASVKIVEGLGFRQEGVLREHAFQDGQPTTSLVYGLLRAAYRTGPGLETFLRVGA